MSKLHEITARAERTAIIAALREHGTARAAAAALGVPRRTLYRRMSIYGISIKRDSEVIPSSADLQKSQNR